MKDTLGKRILVAAIAGFISTVAASYFLTKFTNQQQPKITDE